MVQAGNGYETLMSKRDDDLLKQIRDKFRLGSDADEPQRKRETLSRKMYALEQWEKSVSDSRDSQPAIVVGQTSIPGTPARPCLVLDMLREPVHQIVNQERESDLAVELVAADDFGGLEAPIDPAEIELREGLVRRIQRESESASARTWAFLNTAIGGRGYYAINTRYAEGKTFDQEVYCRRIYDQSGVVLDPAHEEPDGSDAAWGFTFTVMSYDAYKAEYPRAKDAKNSLLTCDKSQWERLGEQAPGWFTFEGEEKYVRVADHWYIDYTSRNLCELPDGSVEWEDALPEGVKPKDTRAVIKKSVKFCKIDGCQILEETDWPSPFIPIIKIVGNEIPPYDGHRCVDGIVNKSAIESQRGRNYMGSRIAEEFGLATISPLMVEEGTIENYEALYSQANTRAFAWLPYRRTNLEGQPGTPPYRPDKSVNVGQMAQGMQIFMESVQTSTNVSNPQMGKPSRFSETWRGTAALIDQGERGTSNYMDNLARSVRYEGRIMDSLLYPIYGRRKGRMTRIVKGDGEAETVMIGRPFTMQDNGQGQQMPVPAPEGATGQTEGVREYALTEHAKSNVAIKVTKGYDTRRQEESAVMGEMVTQNPQMLSVIGDLFFGAQDWPGAKEAKERLKVMLDPKILAMLEQQQGGQNPIPPMALQQMQQMQQQLQQVTQAATQMQQELQTKQYQVQSDERIAMAKLETEKAIAEAKLENERLIAGAKMDAEERRELARQEAEVSKQRAEHLQEINAMAVEAALTPEPAQEQV